MDALAPFFPGGNFREVKVQNGNLAQGGGRDADFLPRLANSRLLYSFARLDLAARPVPQALSEPTLLAAEQNASIFMIDDETNSRGPQGFLEVAFAAGEVYESASLFRHRTRLIGKPEHSPPARTRSYQARTVIPKVGSHDCPLLNSDSDAVDRHRSLPDQPLGLRIGLGETGHN